MQPLRPAWRSTATGRIQPIERVEPAADHWRIADIRDEPCRGSFLAGSVSPIPDAANRGGTDKSCDFKRSAL
jgi:hypothetical protein